MATTVRELMASDPVVLESSTQVGEAARRMRDDDIGDVLVVDGPQLRGIVTDRDLTTRVLADGRNGDTVTLGDVVTTGLETAGPDEDARAIQLDEESALADISAARPDEQG